MRMGLYYSGGFDWPFNGRADDRLATRAGGPADAGYARYATAHWRELIDRYEPAVLWNDIG